MLECSLSRYSNAPAVLLEALQTLGMSLAARSLVRLEEGSQLPKQEI